MPQDVLAEEVAAKSRKTISSSNVFDNEPIPSSQGLPSSTIYLRSQSPMAQRGGGSRRWLQKSVLCFLCSEEFGDVLGRCEGHLVAMVSSLKYLYAQVSDEGEETVETKPITYDSSDQGLQRTERGKSEN